VKDLVPLGLDALRSNFARPPSPFKLTFAVTYNCNSRCKTCSIWEKKSTGELSLSEIRKFFASNGGFRWIAITGGEPFLRQDLYGIVKAAVDTNPVSVLTITTNSLIPSRVVSDVKKMLGLKIPRLILTLSCDGPGKIHDSVRGVPGNFEKICGIYSSLKEHQSENFKIFFGFTLSSFNPNQFEPLYRELNRRFPEIGYDRVHVNVFHYSPHFYSNKRVSGWEARAKREISRIISKRKYSPLDPLGFLEKKYLEGAREFLGTGKSPLPCKAASSSVFLDPHGNVYPCTIWNKVLGNVRKTPSISSFWNSEETALTARKASSLKCPQCWTPCEAYQTIAGNVGKSLFMR